MERTLSSLFSLAIYVCAASFLALVIVMSILAIKWGMNRKKVAQMVAVAQGLDLIEVGIDAERLREKPPEQQLPLEQREALLLKLESGLDLKSIAAITGVNPETAKSRLRYALGKLKSSLAATDEETGS